MKTSASVCVVAVLMMSWTSPLRAQTAEAVSAAAGKDFSTALSLHPPEIQVLSQPPSGAAPGNLEELDGHLYRGADLSTPEQYRYLKQVLVVEVVVDLKETADDAEACRVNGLRCVQFPMKLLWPFVANIDWQTLRQAFAFVLEEQRQGRTVYFHCLHGSDRTGALAAALMVRREACAKSFDRDALWAQVEADMKRHSFHGTLFPALGRDIKNLVYEFEKNESWLCR